MVPSAAALQQAECSVAARERPVVADGISSGLRETGWRALDRVVLGHPSQQGQRLVLALL